MNLAGRLRVHVQTLQDGLYDPRIETDLTLAREAVWALLELTDGLTADDLETMTGSSTADCRRWIAAARAAERDSNHD
jgi:hypothetical protein